MHQYLKNNKICKNAQKKYVLVLPRYLMLRSIYLKLGHFQKKKLNTLTTFKVLHFYIL